MKYRVWNCKIVIPIDSQTINGFDSPPRRAAIEAIESYGIQVISCFSGWGGILTDTEKIIVDDDYRMIKHYSKKGEINELQSR